MRGSSTKTLKMMQELCGTDSLSGLAFVTTKWDEGNTANYDVFESRQKQLQDDFLKESLDRGAKLERHNNTPESACTLIAQFFKRPPVALRIQTELCEQKKDLLQTSAGLVVKSDLELQREKRKGAEDKAGVAQLNNKQSEWENDSAARKLTMREKTEKVDELKQKDPENSRSTLVEVVRVTSFSGPAEVITDICVAQSGRSNSDWHHWRWCEVAAAVLGLCLEEGDNGACRDHTGRCYENCVAVEEC